MSPLQCRQQYLKPGIPLKVNVCNHLGAVWQDVLNNSFQCLNNITRIFIYFFTHTYFQKIQTTLLEQHYKAAPYFGILMVSLSFLFFYFKLLSLKINKLYLVSAHGHIFAPQKSEKRYGSKVLINNFHTCLHKCLMFLQTLAFIASFSH